MRPLTTLVALAILGSAPPPANAQVRDSEVETLRAKLETAQATIARLETRLTDVEKRLPPLDASAREAPRDTAAPPAVAVTKPEPAQPNVDGDDRVIDLADLPRAGPAERPILAADAGASWSVAPPGPIDQPLRPMRDGKAAAFELLAGSGSGRASFTLSRSKDRGGEPGVEATSVFNDTVTLSLSAPLSKDGDTSFATLDGLATGSKVEFGYTNFRGRVLTQAEDSRHPLLIEARRRCRAEVPAYKPGCMRLDQPFMKRFFTPEELDAYERDYARRTIQQSLAWSLRGALGYDEFNYYPVPTLGKETARKVSWSFGGGVTAFPFDRASASVDLDFQRSFKARKAMTTCPVAAAGSTTVVCVPGPLLGPDRTEKLILAPEFRYLLPLSEDGLIRDLGFAPRVEFDVLANAVALDLPVYFAADEKNGLIGGLRFGYVTEDKEFKFGVFVGKSFSLLK